MDTIQQLARVLRSQGFHAEDIDRAEVERLVLRGIRNPHGATKLLRQLLPEFSETDLAVTIIGVGEFENTYETQENHLGNLAHNAEELTLLGASVENIAGIDGVQEFLLDFVTSDYDPDSIDIVD
jgi:hypothetical protein